jgi:hypothetical protein
MTKLENLKWSPRWVTHLGCIRGCLDYLGIRMTDGWLYGATGHAFLLNVQGNLCPSGATDWNGRRFLELGRNAGFRVEGISGWKGKQDLPTLQEQARAFVKKSLAEGNPCYGWEMDMPEYYVIQDADDTGYYISGPGCDEGKGPVAWDSLGTSEIGVVEVRSVIPEEPSEDTTTVREALEFALDFASHPQEWTDGWTGLEAFSVWIRVVEIAWAPAFGLAYHTAVWTECRKWAVSFLEEAVERLSASPAAGSLGRALSEYRNVHLHLEIVKNNYPFDQKLTMDPITQDARAAESVEALKKAQASERLGLEALAEAVDKLKI